MAASPSARSSTRSRSVRDRTRCPGPGRRQGAHRRRRQTDRPTVVNLTQHASFNLAGQGSVAAHLLRVEATRYLPTDADSLPLGPPAEGTANLWAVHETRRLQPRRNWVHPLADVIRRIQHHTRAMSVTESVTRTRPAAWNRRRYWIITGLFCLMFLVSVALTAVDPEGTRTGTEKLGYPVYIATYPLAAAKLAGVAVILWRRWPTLRVFAFAGFLYDLILAVSAHIHERDFPYGWLAVFGLGLWCGAYWVERDRVVTESATHA
jgi:hypothetical protein